MLKVAEKETVPGGINVGAKLFVVYFQCASRNPPNCRGYCTFINVNPRRYGCLHKTCRHKSQKIHTWCNDDSALLCLVLCSITNCKSLVIYRILTLSNRKSIFISTSSYFSSWSRKSLSLRRARRCWIKFNTNMFAMTFFFYSDVRKVELVLLIPFINTESSSLTPRSSDLYYNYSVIL